MTDSIFALLDEMNESGRIAYSDYSDLHDAISALIPESPRPQDTPDEAQYALLGLSQWIDHGNEGIDREALTLHRVIKLTEESGEVVSALIGALGANPRKGVTNGFEKVLDELLDVAVTALGAYEHIDKHQGHSLESLRRKIFTVAQRVGVFPGEAARDAEGLR